MHHYCTSLCRSELTLDSYHGYQLGWADCISPEALEDIEIKVGTRLGGVCDSSCHSVNKDIVRLTDG